MFALSWEAAAPEQVSKTAGSLYLGWLQSLKLHKCLMYTIWFEWTAPPPIRETNQPKVLHTWKHTQVYFDVYDPIWKPHRCLSLSTTGLYSEMKCLMFFTKLVFRYVLSWSFIYFLRGGGNLLWDCWEWSTVEQSNLGDGGHHLHSLANWPTARPLCIYIQTNTETTQKYKNTN